MATNSFAAAPEGEPFWIAAGEDRLLLKHCGDCHRHFHYPRALCPYCMSERTDWVEASGKGTIYAFTVIRRGPDTGTIPAFVTLAEGPTLMTAIVRAEPDDVRIGQPVTVEFIADDTGRKVPVFALEG